MSDSIKHTMLENVVNGIADLRAVKIQAAQFRTQMEPTLYMKNIVPWYYLLHKHMMHNM